MSVDEVKEVEYVIHRGALLHSSIVGRVKEGLHNGHQPIPQEGFKEFAEEPSLRNRTKRRKGKNWP